MSIRTVVAVPTEVRSRASRAHDHLEPGALPALARHVLRPPPEPAPTRVLVTAGAAGVVHDRALVAIDGEDVAGTADVEVAVDGPLMAAVAGRTGFSRGRTDRLGGDLGELVRRSAEAAPEITVLPLELPGHAAAGTLEAIATGLRSAAMATQVTIDVVVAGDLAVSDTRPGGRHPRGSSTAQFDERAVAALRDRDVAGLSGLGPRTAADVGARGWGPLMVAILLAEMADLPLGQPHYERRQGHGQVVISS